MSRTTSDTGTKLNLENAKTALRELKKSISAAEEACRFLMGASVHCEQDYPELSRACERRQFHVERALNELKTDEIVLENELQEAARQNAGRKHRRLTLVR